VSAKDSQQAPAREETSELIWWRPEPGSRKPRLTREIIAAAAVELADAEGLEATTMRRVAGELGVGTMSLYHYVQTKDELLALMHDQITGKLLVPDDERPSDWRAALELIAYRTRALFHRHPWAIDQSPLPLGPNAMRHFEQTVAAVDGLDLDSATKFEIAMTVDDYVYGFALRWLRDGPKRLDEVRQLTAGSDALAAYIQEQLVTGNFPHFQRIVDQEGALATTERLAGIGGDDQRFERGLRHLLDGIALSLPQTRG
jgi:AcrR family transcriptional regulator